VGCCVALGGHERGGGVGRVSRRGRKPQALGEVQLWQNSVDQGVGVLSRSAAADAAVGRRDGIIISACAVGRVTHRAGGGDALTCDDGRDPVLSHTASAPPPPADRGPTSWGDGRRRCDAGVPCAASPSWGRPTMSSSSPSSTSTAITSGTAGAVLLVVSATGAAGAGCTMTTSSPASAACARTSDAAATSAARRASHCAWHAGDRVTRALHQRAPLPPSAHKQPHAQCWRVASRGHRRTQCPAGHCRRHRPLRAAPPGNAVAAGTAALSVAQATAPPLCKRTSGRGLGRGGGVMPRWG
jgi:hypothetical protein